MLKSKHNFIVIGLGGSIIVPGKIQIDFLKKFRKLILTLIKQGHRFVIVTGGGNIARNYVQSAVKICKVSTQDKDWLGIQATRINAYLLKAMFTNKCCPIVLDCPDKRVNLKKYSIYIGSGWKPGFSTDYDTILLAKKFRAEKIIFATDVSHVYEKDIRKYPQAKPMKRITWKDYRKLISSKWRPGMKVPVDPVAAKLAQKLKYKVIITKGNNLGNLKNIIENKKFKGTIIE